MENIIIKNRVGIQNLDKEDIHNIRIDTRDAINFADVDIIKQVLESLDLQPYCSIRYRPSEKGSHETSICIEFLNYVNKENIEMAFWFIGCVLTNLGAYYAVKESKYDSLMKKEGVEREKIKTEKERFLLEELKNSYRAKRNINKKYIAMNSDKEVNYNESVISYGDKEQKIKEDRGEFSARINKLKPSKDIKTFFGMIRIHSLVVDGDSKWTGYFLDEDVIYRTVKILKRGQSISFKIEDSSFKQGLVSNDSLSVDLTIYAELEARIEITDETKVKDFVILEVFKDSKKMEEALRVHSYDDVDLFNLVGVELK